MNLLVHLYIFLTSTEPTSQAYAFLGHLQLIAPTLFPSRVYVNASTLESH